MIKNVLVVIVFAISVCGFSQVNLVPNPTFEKIEKKIKDKGEIKVATPWVSPTLVNADLYVEKTKNYSISVPENSYGKEKPMKGTGYAGIMAFSYKNKMPRSYLQVQLTEKLEIGKEYCVKYYVSLADLSKYATNHLGVAITHNAVTANNSDVLKMESYIESRKLKIYETQYYWTPICGVYKAEGGEEFLTIGNFTEDTQLGLKKVKKSKDFSKPQILDAYYYIDNVSVIALADVKKCDCDVTPGMENVKTVRKDFSSDMNINTTSVKIINTDGSTDANENSVNASVQGSAKSAVILEDKVDGMKIMFSPKTFSIEKSIAKLDILVAHLKGNISDRISISGFIDESEKDVDKLAGRRVGNVYKYLISKGITKERLERSIEGTNSPVDIKEGVKNMRVEISIL